MNNIIENGFCKNCNKPLLYKKINLFGKELLFPIACTCQNLIPTKNTIENNKYQKKHQEILKLKKWSNIGIKNENSSFDNYIKTKNNIDSFNYINYYCKNFNQLSKNGSSILLYGDVGNGKTHLAIATMNTLISLNYSVIFIKATRLITELDESKDFNSKDKTSDIINMLSKSDLLILDDLGANIWNKKTLDYLYKIIDNRYDNNKPMFITTNITPEYLSQILGNRIYDRLRGCCKFIENKEASYRLHEFNISKNNGTI